MSETITFLYLCNALIASFAYTPQCWKLWVMLKTDCVDRSVSLATWLMWMWACSVTFIYAFVVSEDDLAFKAVSTVNVLLCLVTVVLTVLVYRRYNNKNNRKKDKKKKGERK